MKERPILMSGPMVSAIRAGRKTQTRRILKGDSKQIYLTLELLDEIPPPVIHGEWTQLLHPKGGPLTCVRTPFQKGQSLWVKEALGRKPASFLGIEATTGVESAFYQADGEDVVDEHGFNLCPWWKGKSLSPIHMPRWASRITLEVTDVRVERLQDISEVDAFKEGCGTDDCRRCNTEGLEQSGPHKGLGCEDCSGEGQISSRANYPKLWESIHGPGTWDLNPWVFAVSFRRIEEVPHD